MAGRKHSGGTLIETFAGVGSPKIDRSANVIREMKIASWVSKNGRDYTKALKGNAGLYEGAFVSLNHPAGNNVPSVESRFGQYKNVTEKADGIYGDLHFNPKHSSAESIVWFAENMPGAIANSHRVEAKAQKNKSGVLDVQQITKVRGVEIVTEGGMNDTLFEDYAPAADGEKPAAPDPKMTACIARVMGTGKSRTEAEGICSATPDESPNSPPESAATESLEEAAIGDKVLVNDYGGRQVVGTVLKKAPALLVQVGDCLKTVWEDGAIVATGIPSTTATEALMGNLANMSLEEIRAARPDLADALLKEARENDASESELKALREENQKFKLAEEKRSHEEKQAARVTALREQCKAAKVPEALISDLFIESLVGMTDEKKIADLIAERRETATGPKPKSNAGDPSARINAGKPGLSTKQLSESLNGI